MPTKTKKAKKVQVLTPSDVQKAINKRFGPGTMMFGSDPALRIQRIPCGVLSVDWRLGGGFARGRSYEVYGNFSVGKTSLGLRLCAMAQAEGGRAAYVDCEKTFDPVYAAACGVKVKRLAYHQQRQGEQCVDFIEALLRSELYDVIVLDSIAALAPQAELSESMSDIGGFGTYQARLMSKALRKLTTANSRTVLYFINQQRENVGSMFGNKWVTSGGRAMGFYASTRLELVRTETIKRTAKLPDEKTGELKDTKVAVGHRVLVNITKDKTGGAKQHDKTTFVFDYTTNQIDPIEDLLYIGRVTGVVHKTGPKWYLEGYEDEVQESRGKFKAWLRRQPMMQEELLEAISQSERTTTFNDDGD